MRSGLLLLMVAAMIVAGCRTVSYQTVDSATVESAVFSSADKVLAEALAAFLYGCLIAAEVDLGPDRALPYYQYAAQRNPGSHTIHSRIAVAALYQADLPAAINALETSLAAKPDDPIRQIDLAALYQVDNRLDAAAALFRQSLIGNATNSSVYVALADIYFRQGKHTQTTDLIATAFTHVPDITPLLSFLHQKARLLVAANQYEQAIAYFSTITQVNEAERAQMKYVIAELHLAQQQTTEALQVLYETIALPHAPAEAFQRLGALLFAQEDSQEAIRVMRTGIERYPNLVFLPFALGGLYVEAGQYDKALKAYEDAMRLTRKKADPGDAQTTALRENQLLIAIAFVQERMQRFEDAAQALERVLEITPDSHIAMNFLAYMWAELDQNIDKAYELSKRSLVLDPDNGAYLDTLGWIYYRKGLFDKALAYLQKAQKQLGPDPEVTLHFGDVYAATGQQNRALQFWKESLRLHPTEQNRAWEQLVNAGINPEACLSATNDGSKESVLPANHDCQTVPHSYDDTAINHDTGGSH